VESAAPGVVGGDVAEADAEAGLADVLELPRRGGGGGREARRR
jgi:hypothetical protein